MTNERDQPPARRRGLTAAERELWKAATRAVRPMVRLARASKKAGEVLSAAPPKASPAPPPAPSRPPPSRPPPPTAASPRRSPPPLAPLDRRTTQRVARGRHAIDARIDLHGLTQDGAHGALLHFLRRAQADGARLVLVITGKGGRGSLGGDPGRGVLHGAVPRWLALPDFRPYVVGFERAHIAHGGDGALYLQIRRGRG